MKKKMLVFALINLLGFVTSRNFLVTANKALCPRICKCYWNQLDFVVNCSAVGLTNIPTEKIPKHTTILELDSNNITSLENFKFANLPDLKVLNLDNNQITMVTNNIFASFKSLISLSFNGNDLTSIASNTFEGLTNLYELHIQRNKISTLKASILEKNMVLSLLDLKDNYISNIDKNAFKNKNLTQLDLSNNNIKTLPYGVFNELPMLTTLSLNQNRLESISNVFNKLERLEVLDLSNNAIKSIDKYAFSNAKSLRDLQLSSNNISYISYDILSSNKKLSMVNLSLNRHLQCNCQLILFMNSLSSDISGNCQENSTVTKPLLTLRKSLEELMSLNCNICSLVPCHNNGKCLYNSTGTGYTTCKCTTTNSNGRLCKSTDCYKTQSCGICKQATCKNNGTCTEINPKKYKCTCNKYFTGQTCESKINTCNIKPHPCNNHGVCEQVDNNFSCHCNTYYTGKYCQTLIPCSKHKCKNNAQCVPSNSSVDSNYTCKCSAGYYGNYCQFANNPCLKQPCRNNATCKALNATSFVCNCAENYTGTVCNESKVINYCLSGQCMHGANCIMVNAANFVCKCTNRYTGRYCETVLNKELTISDGKTGIPNGAVNNEEEIKVGVVIGVFLAIVVLSIISGIIYRRNKNRTPQHHMFEDEYN